jgi:hypothetical protein
MTMTVVEDLNPEQPLRWQDAAKIVVCDIFDSTEPVLNHLSSFPTVGRRRVYSSTGPVEKDENLELVLEGLGLLDTQFEGMLNNYKFFDSDDYYWIEEWTNLGAIAAAAGIKNGDLMLNVGSPQLVGHPEFMKSASAGVFDSWMLREEVTATLIKKQMDYGPENISRFGRQGLLVRCHDKLARLRNLHIVRQGQASNESVTDTYLDIVGYSAIGMMWERGWFLLPLN